jgi:uncharacterized damage-inducible protein DinB
MDTSDLFEDAFGRIYEQYADLAGLDHEALHHRPGGTGNSIAWLLWHLARVQDNHVADLAGAGELWPSWRDRFGLALDPDDTGYGHISEQVDAVRVEDPALLTGYHSAVHEATMSYVSGLSADDLDRVVDRRWNPPVTAGVRLVSVVEDCLQHLGQAAYVRGLIQP